MPITPRYVEFDADRPDEVVSLMETMAQLQEGWINFEPAIPVEEMPPPGGGIFSIFSGRGPAVPLGTWTAPSTPRRGRSEPALIGLQHPAGGKAKPLLEQFGHPVPEGWPVTQDYVKKGMVIAVPPTAASDDVVRWLLRAATLLSGVNLTGKWRAAVYRG